MRGLRARSRATDRTHDAPRLAPFARASAPRPHRRPLVRLRLPRVALARQPQGFYCSAGSAAPTACPEGRVGRTSLLTAAEFCASCPPPTHAAEGSRFCDSCQANFFSLPDTGDELAPTDCQPCPDQVGFSCPTNTTLTNIGLSQGFWRLSPRSMTVYECLYGSNGTACVGGSAAGDRGDGYCLQGHHGPRCMLCTDANQYFEPANGVCTICPPLDHLIQVSLGMGLLLLALLALGYTVYKCPPRRCICVSVQMRRVWLKLVGVGLIAKMKLLIVFYQLVYNIPEIYGVRMPPGYQRFIRQAWAWIDFDWWVYKDPTPDHATTRGTAMRVHV